MACDRNRKRYFKTLVISQALADALGGSSAAEETLHLIYDVAANQAPPEDEREVKRETRAMERMVVRAKKLACDLHPHAKTPKPHVRHAWSVIAATLEAVELNSALPPIAEDARRSVAFQSLCKRPHWGWAATTTPMARTALRQGFAAHPELLADLLADDGSVGRELYADTLAEMTYWLASDDQHTPETRAAAAHYLTLHDADALTDDDRATWARVLAARAAVGVLRNGTPPRYGPTYCCPHCGRHDDEHVIGGRCMPGDVEELTAMAVAATRVLADPAYGKAMVSGSPYTTMETLLNPWMRSGEVMPPEGPLGDLLVVARANDRRLAVFLARELPDHAHGVLDDYQVMMRLRDATLRTPVMFEGRPYVWAQGKLYDAAAYRARFNWDKRLDKEYSRLRSPLAPYAELPRAALARLMAGEALAPSEITFRQFSGDELLRRFPTVTISATAAQMGDLFPHACGCLYAATGGKPNKLIHQGTSSAGACPHHPAEVLLTPAMSLNRVDMSRPRFPLPAWP